MTDLQQLMSNLPAWAREPAVLIGAGVVVALLLLWLLSRLFRGGPRDEAAAETDYVEEVPVTRPITPPPVTPAPPPIVEEPLAPPTIEAAPEPVAEAIPGPEPVAFVEPAPALVPAPEAVPEPASLYVPEEAPEPAPLVDEPIAAAAPLDASPASIAVDVPEPVAQPEPVAPPEPVAEPEPVAAPAGPDDLTRMKGVGPRLADRLGSVGIASFAQIAALTPEEADALDARLGDFQGRIHRDRWIEQAGYLANGDIAGFEEVFGKL